MFNSIHVHVYKRTHIRQSKRRTEIEKKNDNRKELAIQYKKKRRKRK